MIERQFLSLVVLLVAPAIGQLASDTENHQLKLTFPEPAWSYDSVVEGNQVDDFTVGFEGRLDVFPCSAEQGPPPRDDGDRVVVPLGYLRGLDKRLTFSVIEEGVGFTDVGLWEVNYWWGRYEDAPFENGDQAYTWGRALFRHYRVAGDGEWCSNWFDLPREYQILGEPLNRNAWRDNEIKLSELNGTKATLAVRFSHYSLDDDIDDPDLMPRNVTTACVFVQFTSEDVPFGETCRRPDTIVDGPQLPADWQAPAWWAASEPSSSEPTPTRTRSPTDEDSGLVFRPTWVPEDSREWGESSNTGTQGSGLTRPEMIGIIVGSVVGSIVLAFCCCCGCCCFVARREKRRAARLRARVPIFHPDEEDGGSPSPGIRTRATALAPAPAPAPAPSRDPEVVEVPAPAYRPSRPRNGESELLRQYREVAEAGDSNHNVNNHNKATGEQPPQYGDLPPRYEEVEAGPSSRRLSEEESPGVGPSGTRRSGEVSSGETRPSREIRD